MRLGGKHLADWGARPSRLPFSASRRKPVRLWRIMLTLERQNRRFFGVLACFLAKMMPPDDFSACKNDFHMCGNEVSVCKIEVTVCELGVTVCRNGVAVCKLEVTARKECFTVCKQDVAMRKLEPTAPPEHRTMPPESLLWTAGGKSAMSPLAELENLLIPGAAHLPALTELPHSASNARQAASSFFRLALDLASM